jgi:hypothetical protein
MKNVVRILAALTAASVFAGCGASNSAGAGYAPASALGMRTAPHGLRPNGPWEFWIVNSDSTRTLHVVNTHRGQCVERAEIPTIDIAPNKSWSGVIWTHASGSCLLLDSIQDIELYYQPIAKDPKQYLELSYLHGYLNTAGWAVGRIGGLGTLDKPLRDLDAPVNTNCSVLSDGTMNCIARTKRGP